MPHEKIHNREKKVDTIHQRLNTLRAGVLGANDGIVSVAATVIGVAAALPENLAAIATAGFAAVSAGAFSMAAGEYVSVSTQRDTEKAIVDRVKTGATSDAISLITEVVDDLKERGVTPQLAERAAAEMFAHDPIDAVARVEGIDPDDLVNPWHAAIASFFAFIAGALLPMAAILLFPTSIRIPVTFVSVILALVLTGWFSARWGGADPKRAAFRTVIGGALGMAFTYGVGLLFNVGLS